MSYVLEGMIKLLHDLSLRWGMIALAFEREIRREDALVKPVASRRNFSSIELAFTLEVLYNCFFIILRAEVQHRVQVIVFLASCKRAHMMLNFDHI